MLPVCRQTYLAFSFYLKIKASKWIFPKKPFEQPFDQIERVKGKHFSIRKIKRVFSYTHTFILDVLTFYTEHLTVFSDALQCQNHCINFEPASDQCDCLCEPAQPRSLPMVRAGRYLISTFQLLTLWMINGTVSKLKDGYVNCRYLAG